MTQIWVASNHSRKDLHNPDLGRLKLFCCMLVTRHPAARELDHRRHSPAQCARPLQPVQTGRRQQGSSTTTTALGLGLAQPSHDFALHLIHRSQDNTLATSIPVCSNCAPQANPGSPPALQPRAGRRSQPRPPPGPASLAPRRQLLHAASPARTLPRRRAHRGHGAAGAGRPERGRGVQGGGGQVHPCGSRCYCHDACCCVGGGVELGRTLL